MRKVVIEFLGQDKSASKTAEQVEKKTSKLGGTLAAVGKTAALGLGAGLLAGASAMAVLTKGAAEDQQAQDKLAKTLKNTANATDTQVKAVEDYISQVGIATGVTDDAMRPAFENLVRATGDVSKAQNLMNLALDVSAGTGKDLGAVTMALAKAENGQVGALGRLGIATKDANGKTKDFAAITADLAKMFGGQAAVKADTFSGKMARLKLVAAETGETIGGKLIPIATGLSTWFLNKGVPAIDAGVTAVGNFADKAVDALRPVARGLSQQARKWAPAVKGWVDDIDFGRWASGIIAGTKTGLETGDWAPLGKSMAEALVNALKGAADLTEKIVRAILDALVDVNWLELGKDGAKIAVPFALGFVNGLLDAIIDVAKEHPGEFLLAIASIIPIGRIGGLISKMLSKIPFLKSFAPLFKGLETVTAPFNKAIDGIVKFIGRTFLEGFRRVFPDVGAGFGKSLALLPIRLQILAIELQAKALQMMLGIAKAIGRGIGWVIAKIGELIGRMLKPFAKAGMWLIRRGTEFVTGLLRGIGSTARRIGTWILTNVIRPVLAPFARAGSWLINQGRGVITGLKSGILSVARGIGTWVMTNVIRPAIAPFVHAGRWLVGHGSSFLTGLKAGVLNVVRGIGGWMLNNVIRPAIGPFVHAGKWLWRHGGNLINGLKVGILGAMASMGSWIKEHVIDPIVGAVKRFFGIRSPSRVFASIGGNLIAGLMRGLGSNRGTAIAKRVFGDMPGALRAVVSKGLIPIAGLPSKALAALGGAFGAPELNIPGSVLGGPWKRMFFRGELLNMRTIRMIQSAERMLGGFKFPITQGSYERATSYSGTTHTGGGVFDAVMRPVTTEAVQALRRAGFAAWDRTGKGNWAPHIHAVAIGDPTAAASAKGQVRDYLRGGDGLAGRAAGGPVAAGWPYKVGERGEEVFVPDHNGHIVPNHALRRGGDGTIAQLTVNLNLDGRTVQQVLLKLKNNNGGLALGLA